MKRLKRLEIRKILESSIIKDKLINEALIKESAILLIESLSPADYKKLMSAAGSGNKKAFTKMFRKLAVAYHPDKWATSSKAAQKAAEEGFKQLQNVNIAVNNFQGNFSQQQSLVSRLAKETAQKAGYDAAKAATSNPAAVEAAAAKAAEKTGTEIAKKTGAEVAKKTTQTAETGLAKASAEAGKAAAKSTGKAALQTAAGETSIVLREGAEGAIEKGAALAKQLPQLEATISNQVAQNVQNSGIKMPPKVIKDTTHMIMGEIADSPQTTELIEQAAKKGAEETVEVAIQAEASFLGRAVKMLGPAVVAAFGMYQVYDALTNEEYNDEQVLTVLNKAMVGMAVGFGTIAAGVGFLASMGWTIAALGGMALGKAFNDYMTVDTADLFVSIGRQAADKVGVLDTGMFTKWHEENEWAQDFIDASAKQNFKGLTPKDIDPKRGEAIFNLLRLERAMMLNGIKIMDAEGENAKSAKKLRSLFDKGFLDAEAWYAAAKKKRKEEEQKLVVKPPEGDENKKKDSGKDDQAIKKKSKAASGWNSYLEKTKSELGPKVKSGFEELAKAGIVNNGKFSTWVDFYNQMRKDPETMKQIGKKPGSHLTPSEVIKIYDFVLGKKETLKEKRIRLQQERLHRREMYNLDQFIMENQIKTKIIRSKKIINLIN